MGPRHFEVKGDLKVPQHYLPAIYCLGAKGQGDRVVRLVARKSSHSDISSSKNDISGCQIIFSQANKENTVKIRGFDQNAGLAVNAGFKREK